jgi:hypothetical protein
VAFYGAQVARVVAARDAAAARELSSSIRRAADALARPADADEERARFERRHARHATAVEDVHGHDRLAQRSGSGQLLLVDSDEEAERDDHGARFSPRSGRRGGLADHSAPPVPGRRAPPRPRPVSVAAQAAAAQLHEEAHRLSLLARMWTARAAAAGVLV